MFIGLWMNLRRCFGLRITHKFSGRGMTVDNIGIQGGFDEYAGIFNALQPVGDPRSVFKLSDGPAPINYVVNPDGTVPYPGANYGSRTAFWRVP